MRCDFASMKTRHKFTIAKMDIFCFWSQGWFDSIPGLKFWCCYYVSRWERDEKQKKRRRRDVWYEFLQGRTAISKPVGKCDLWWNLQNIHKEWYLCMREVELWSRLGVADKMPTRCYKSKSRERGRRKDFILSSKCFDIFVWSVSEILWQSPHRARREMWNLMGEGKGQSRDENHAPPKNCMYMQCYSWGMDIGVRLVIFLSLSSKDNTKPPSVRASWRNPDPYGRQAGTWRLDKAEVKRLWVKGQERRPDVEAEERPVNHLRSFCLLINCLSPWEAGEQLSLSFWEKRFGWLMQRLVVRKNSVVCFPFFPVPLVFCLIFSHSACDISLLSFYVFLCSIFKKNRVDSHASSSLWLYSMVLWPKC